MKHNTLKNSILYIIGGLIVSVILMKCVFDMIRL
jgi:hypothetical protein